MCSTSESSISFPKKKKKKFFFKNNIFSLNSCPVVGQQQKVHALIKHVFLYFRIELVDVFLAVFDLSIVYY